MAVISFTNTSNLKYCFTEDDLKGFFHRTHFLYLDSSSGVKVVEKSKISFWQKLLAYFGCGALNLKHIFKEWAGSVITIVDKQDEVSLFSNFILSKGRKYNKNHRFHKIEKHFLSKVYDDLHTKKYYFNGLNHEELKEELIFLQTQARELLNMAKRAGIVSSVNLNVYRNYLSQLSALEDVILESSQDLLEIVKDIKYSLDKKNWKVEEEDSIEAFLARFSEV